MRTNRRLGRIIAAVGGLGVILPAALFTALAGPSEALAAGGWGWWRHHKAKACPHPGCGPDRCLATTGWAGAWYWMRSPDQEQRVVMGLFNRYCIRCHGIDGRGVWDIPDVPDFTDSRWQTSRPDPQIVNILMEGRGAVMPSFRGTLTLEEAWAMAHYLRTFVPGTELRRPDVGRVAVPDQGRGAGSSDAGPPPPLPELPAPTSTR